MPVVSGRLTCCSCGADLGDASDPYRDPDCGDCLNRDAQAEHEADMQRDAEQANIVCPNWPDPEGGDIEGCGSRNVVGPDDEGLYDCRDCGIWFTVKAKEVVG